MTASAVPGSNILGPGAGAHISTAGRQQKAPLPLRLPRSQHHLGKSVQSDGFGGCPPLALPSSVSGEGGYEFVLPWTTGTGERCQVDELTSHPLAIRSPTVWHTGLGPQKCHLQRCRVTGAACMCIVGFSIHL